MALPDPSAPPPASRLRTGLAAATPVALLMVLVAAGLVDMPRAHQALGLSDTHNRTDPKIGHPCDTACGRRRVSAVGSPDGPAPDRP